MNFCTALSNVVSNVNGNSGGGQIRGQVRDDGDVLDLDVLGDSCEEDRSVDSGIVEKVEIVSQLVIS